MMAPENMSSYYDFLIAANSKIEEEILKGVGGVGLSEKMGVLSAEQAQIRILDGISDLSLIQKIGENHWVVSYTITGPAKTTIAQGLPVYWACGTDKAGDPCDFEITLGLGPVKKDLQIKARGSTVAGQLPECNKMLDGLIDGDLNKVPGLKNGYLKSMRYRSIECSEGVENVTLLVLNIIMRGRSTALLRLST